MSKQKGFYATLNGPKKEVVYLESFYFQGGKWHKQKEVKKNVKRRKSA